MSELINHIGALKFLQVAIEGWNEIFLLILISIMLIGVKRDKTGELLRKIKIPLTNELILFFTATFVYNFCNIIYLWFGGMPTVTSYWCIRIGMFGYYASGEFQTLLFLRVIKKYIVEKLETPLLKKTVCAFELLQIPNILLLLLTPFTNALYYIDANNDYYRSWGYWIWQSITILTFVFIGVVIIVKWKNISNYLKRVIITATIFPMTALVTSPFIPASSLNNIMVAITALILFIIYEKNKTEITLKSIYELEKAKTALAESRLTMMLAQIKPHFIYNSMSAIMELCYTEPELAAETIAHFSDYLRGKLDAFDSKELSWFDDELVLIKEYLSIEYADHNKVFRMEYDLSCTDFRLPALTVQPLVENAVKHGIDRYSADSLVQLVTYEDEHSIYIRVTDNATAEQGDDAFFAESRGIGLNNVRERLQMLCGGDISVAHNQNGTSVIVTIPKTEQQEL